jgi:single-strand DNA-binding protein
MNTWFGIGRLTADPELRYTGSGTAVCSFTIAVDRARKDSQGNKQTDFVPVIVWQKLGELCSQYLTKGRQAAVQGELTSRTYENRDGQKVKVWEVIASNVQFLDRGDSGGQGASNTQQPKPARQFEDDPFASDDIPDDGELPF